MMNTQYQGNRFHIHDRTALNAMQAEWIAKNGEPRRFERGFSSEWEPLQRLMAGLGFELLYRGTRFYTLLPFGWKGATNRLDRNQLITRIDQILADNGHQPFVWRGKP